MSGGSCSIVMVIESKLRGGLELEALAGKAYLRVLFNRLAMPDELCPGLGLRLRFRLRSGHWRVEKRTHMHLASSFPIQIL